MILTDTEILKKIKNKEIVIKPEPTDEQIQPSSIDIRLDKEFWKPIKTEEVLDIKNTEPKYSIIKANAIIIPPGEFILGTTKEHIEIPADLIARVEGRSSVARLGVMIEAAGFVDSGFHGTITLEIKNISNQSIMLYEGMRIGQLVFEETTGIPDRLYGECGNKYQDQKGVVGSLIYWDTENKPVK